MPKNFTKPIATNYFRTLLKNIFKRNHYYRCSLRAECTNVDNRRIKLIHGIISEDLLEFGMHQARLKFNSGLNSGLTTLKFNPRVSVD